MYINHCLIFGTYNVNDNVICISYNFNFLVFSFREIHTITKLAYSRCKVYHNPGELHYSVQYPSNKAMENHRDLPYMRRLALLSMAETADITEATVCFQ